MRITVLYDYELRNERWNLLFHNPAGTSNVPANFSIVTGKMVNYKFDVNSSTEDIDWRSVTLMSNAPEMYDILLKVRETLDGDLCLRRPVDAIEYLKKLSEDIDSIVNKLDR